MRASLTSEATFSAISASAITAPSQGISVISSSTANSEEFTALPGLDRRMHRTEVP